MYIYMYIVSQNYVLHTLTDYFVYRNKIGNYGEDHRVMEACLRLARGDLKSLSCEKRCAWPGPAAWSSGFVYALTGLFLCVGGSVVDQVECGRVWSSVVEVLLVVVIVVGGGGGVPHKI